MTFSICAHETYENEDDELQHRFGVAVTTRRPAIGSRCPFVSSQGAIATQSVTDPRLGRKGLQYVEDGLALDDAMTALLNADQNSAERQVHGVTQQETFTYSGDDCTGWYGHQENGNFTVAGNMLVGSEVLDRVATQFEAADPSKSFPRRLIESLQAGYEVGGDKRHERQIQSAAVRVRTDEDRPFPVLYHDLRVDATENPIDDLLEEYRQARIGANE